MSYSCVCTMCFVLWALLRMCLYYVLILCACYVCLFCGHEFFHLILPSHRNDPVEPPHY